MNDACKIGFEELVAYRFADLEAAREPELEEHLFSCPRCGARAELLTRFDAALREVFRRGGLTSSASARTVDHAADLGLTLRTYTLAPGESVACTAAPDDDLVVVRLHIDAPHADRVDIETEIAFAATDERRTQVLEDVPVDASSGELVYLFSAALVRSFPRSSWTMRARVHAAGGLSHLGPYTMNHTPWHELPHADRSGAPRGPG